MIRTEAQEAFWQKFLAASGRDSSTPCYDCFHFCLDEKSANELLELVLAGKKRATAGSLPSYEREGVRSPQAGDLSILTDFDGKPHCVIRTTAVTVLPFCGMTYEICKREGEDDSLDSQAYDCGDYSNLTSGYHVVVLYPDLGEYQACRLKKGSKKAGAGRPLDAV